MPKGGMTIAVLTGRRPALLAKTLEAMRKNQPQVWRSSVRVVFHNSGDAATAEVLDQYRWDERRTHEGDLLSIGAASARLVELAGIVDQRYVLRLEDDWWADGTEFVEDSVALLESVGQVRLRKASERTMSRHRLTNQPIRWRRIDGKHQIARSAHFTHNPSLMRTWDLVAMGAYRDEIEAARRFDEAGWAVAQHSPGVFRHLGDRKAGLSLKWGKG
jgi:hypothetical protein